MQLTKQGKLEAALTCAKIAEVLEQEIGALATMGSDGGGIEKSPDSKGSEILVSGIHSTVKADVVSLENGQVYGNNRNYQFIEVPEEQQGMSFLRMECRKSPHYDLRVEGKCVAYLIVITAPVNPWSDAEETKLTQDGWQKTAHKITTKGTSTIFVFEREFEDEKLKFHGNRQWAHMIAARVPIKIAGAE